MFILESYSNLEYCTLPDGKTGQCVDVQSCPYALKLLKSNQIPQLCGFVKNYTLVCCRRIPGEISSKSKYFQIFLLTQDL